MNGNIENVEMKLQDLYGAVKIAAVMANGADEMFVSTHDIQGMLRCFLTYVEDLMKTCREGGR